MDIVRSIRETLGRKRLFFVDEKRSGRLEIWNNTSFTIDHEESSCDEAIYVSPIHNRCKAHVHAYSKKHALELAAERIAIARAAEEREILKLEVPKSKLEPPPIERKENKIRQLVTHA